MKKAFIMRGLPGSGKSTKARELAGSEGVIHSTDDFFMVDGEYRFVPADIKANHDRNFIAFCMSLEKGIPIVICDNTNSKHWEYARYEEAAKKAGYEVEIVSMPHPSVATAVARTLHKVPQGAIEAMLLRWEA
jgi:predicted kinase